MADERVDEAVDVVARRVIADVLDPLAVGDLWENYPDLGEDDWQAVQTRVQEIITGGVGRIDQTTYTAAYDYLESRAEHDV